MLERRKGTRGSWVLGEIKGKELAVGSDSGRLLWRLGTLNGGLCSEGH
jgi:hypothetical protein